MLVIILNLQNIIYALIKRKIISIFLKNIMQYVYLKKRNI